MLQADHDTIVRIEEMVKTITADRVRVNDALFGDDGAHGIVKLLYALKAQVAYILVVGSGMASVLAWLIAIHVIK